MKTRVLFSTSLLVMISTSSCGANINNPHISKNGDLDVLNEITYENAFIEADFDYMDKMIKSEEKFIFYLTSLECSHCAEFKNKITEYIKNTHNLVAKMDIYYDNPLTGETDYNPEFKSFMSKYTDYFFINHEVLTPQVYIVSGLNVASKVSSSRYSTTNMFTNAMNEYVYSSNVYSFTSINAYKQFEDNNEKLVTAVVDRSIENNYKLYNAGIDKTIKYSDKKTALIEINDKNREEFTTYLSMKDTTLPYLIYKEKTDKKSCQVDSVDKAQDFIKSYL